MKSEIIRSWATNSGRVVRRAESSNLPYSIVGSLTSYHDQALPSSSFIRKCESRFLDFDKQTGIICLSGNVTLREILCVVRGSGYFFKSTPGTLDATVGGVISCNSGGKNSEIDSSFAHSIISLSVETPNGENIFCENGGLNNDLFRCLVGGVGLIGIISFVKLQLDFIGDHFSIREKIFRLNSLSDIVHAHNSEAKYFYTHIFFDKSGKLRANVCQGLPKRGKDNSYAGTIEKSRANRFVPRLPFINRLTIRLFQAYLEKFEFRKREVDVQLVSFMYPFETIGVYNKLFGTRGFHECQFFVEKKQLSEVLLLIEERLRPLRDNIILISTKFNSNSLSVWGPDRQTISIALNYFGSTDKLNEVSTVLNTIIAEYSVGFSFCKDSAITKETFLKIYSKALNKFLMVKKDVDPHENLVTEFYNRLMR